LPGGFKKSDGTCNARIQRFDLAGRNSELLGHSKQLDADSRSFVPSEQCAWLPKTGFGQKRIPGAVEGVDFEPAIRKVLDDFAVWYAFEKMEPE
jgi:hypothetical protein